MTVTRKFHPQVDVLQSRGLLNFDIAGVENGIGLCVKCHRAFDDLYHPGMVFLPTDLGYFINFEENDRLRRALDGSQRLCPTAEEYRAHQEEAGLASSDDIGGLYTIYILEKFGEDWTEDKIDRVTSQPRRWHGAPMATIRKGIHILGSLNISRMPTEVVEQLRRLQDLYQTDPPTSSTHPPPPPANPPPPPKRGKKPPPPSRRSTPSTRYGRTRAQYSEVPRSGHGKTASYSHDRTSQWVFGPDSTSELAVKRVKGW